MNNQTADQDTTPMGAVYAALADEYRENCTPEQNAIRAINGRMPNVSGFAMVQPVRNVQIPADRHGADFPLA